MFGIFQLLVKMGMAQYYTVVYLQLCLISWLIEYMGAGAHRGFYMLLLGAICYSTMSTCAWMQCLRWHVRIHLLIFPDVAFDCSPDETWGTLAFQVVFRAVDNACC